MVHTHQASRSYDAVLSPEGTSNSLTLLQHQDPDMRASCLYPQGIPNTCTSTTTRQVLTHETRAAKIPWSCSSKLHERIDALKQLK